MELGTFVLRLCRQRCHEVIAHDVPPEVLPLVHLMFGGIGGCCCFSLPLPFCLCLIDTFVTLCQRYRTQRINQFLAPLLVDAVGQCIGLMIHGVEDRRNPVAHKFERCCRCTLCGNQCRGLFITLFHLRIERQHVKLTTEYRLDDTTCFRFHDGIAVHELGVIEFRLELQSGGAVALAVLSVAIIDLVDGVEGRQHITVVKGNVIEVWGVEVHDHRHRLAVSADGTRHHLTVHGKIVFTRIGHVAIRLANIFPGILGQHIHGGDEPEDGVTFLHVEADLRIYVVLQTVDRPDMCLVERADLTQYQRIFPGTSHGCRHTKQ